MYRSMHYLLRATVCGFFLLFMVAPVSAQFKAAI